jgi:hypothetical protein
VDLGVGGEGRDSRSLAYPAVQRSRLALSAVGSAKGVNEVGVELGLRVVSSCDYAVTMELYSKNKAFIGSLGKNVGFVRFIRRLRVTPGQMRAPALSFPSRRPRSRNRLASSRDVRG